MIDINVKKCLEQVSQCRKGAGTSIDPVKKQVLEIVLSESDVGIELEVAELQATELELSSAMLSLLPLT